MRLSWGNSRTPAMGNDQDRPEPYRLFFLIGLGMGVVGVLPWIFLQMGIGFLPWNPIAFHGRTMFWGFLGAFVSGFLMTAAPKMSGSWPARPWETALIASLLLAQVLFSFLGLEVWSLLSIVGVVLGLLSFLGRRFLGRRQNPPAMFIFVPVALFSVLVGSGLLLSGMGSAETLSYAKRLMYDAFILNLIVGLGSRLIPVLTRVPGALAPSGPGDTVSLWRGYLIVLVLLNASFILEAFVAKEAGFLLRAVVLGTVLVRNFKVFAPRNPAGFLSSGIRLAAWSLALPYLGALAFPAWELHFLHLSYIGGFALLTLMIAVRVVLAHGDQPLTLELKTSALLGVAGLMLTAALLRGLWPLIQPEHLFQEAALASFVWLGALLLWQMAIGKKIKNAFQTLWLRSSKPLEK
ncbi:MAG: NnrS family protein [Bdellovibrionaceae bacterium]|nr:NnrS family protein [Pseudobdellovibrionaceae bacterium]